MYSVRIRDHIMIAHSLPDEFFGPAQKMHGATYVVDAVFYSEKLNPQNTVIDIGLASVRLSGILKDLNYRNLDEHPDMSGEFTTTEYLARYIHDQLRSACRDVFTGTIEVILGESHVAWASYRGD